MSGQRPRPVRCFGEGQPQCKSGASEPGRQIAHQLCLASPDVRAARHIEDQPVRRIKRDHRGRAIAIIGHSFKQGGIRLRIMVDCRQIGNTRPRISERHAGSNAQRERCLVDRNDPHRPALFFDEGAGGRRSTLRVTPPSVGAEHREEQR